MSCNCYDPIGFGHQDKHCPRSLSLALDDLECYRRAERDEDTRSQWYTEQARERQKLGIEPESDLPF